MLDAVEPSASEVPQNPVAPGVVLLNLKCLQEIQNGIGVSRPDMEPA
jgi:hypothetical protein